MSNVHAAGHFPWRNCTACIMYNITQVYLEVYTVYFIFHLTCQLCQQRQLWIWKLTIKMLSTCIYIKTMYIYVVSAILKPACNCKHFAVAIWLHMNMHACIFSHTFFHIYRYNYIGLWKCCKVFLSKFG